MIRIRLATIVRVPQLRSEAPHLDFYFLDVELPCIPRSGEIVVWTGGGEGVVRQLRLLASPLCAWRAFPKTDGILVEAWLVDRFDRAGELGAFLLERDGWCCGTEDLRRRALRPAATDDE